MYRLSLAVLPPHAFVLLHSIMRMALCVDVDYVVYGGSKFVHTSLMLRHAHAGPILGEHYPHRRRGLQFPCTFRHAATLALTIS